MPRSLFLLTPLATALLISSSAYADDHHHGHGHDHDHSGHAHEHDAYEHSDDGHSNDEHSEAENSINVSLVVEGIYHNRFSGDANSPAGFSHEHEGSHDHEGGHDHSGHSHDLDNGFNLGHSEVAIEGQTAHLEGKAVVSLTEDDITLEEAFIATRTLPNGLRLQAGKFLSDIGYINSRHPHAWDFVERPLVNEYLFGEHGLLDTGLQLTWSPNSTLTLGSELFQGEGEGFSRFDEGGYEDRASGPRVGTIFAKYRPDLGANKQLTLGTSAGMNRQYVRVDDHGHHAHTAEGDNWFAGLDARFNYDAEQPGYQGNWQLGAEYFYSERDLQEHVQHHDHFHAHDHYTEQQDGAYIDAIYGIAPRWEVGLRAEALGLTNKVMGTHPTAIVSEDTSWRHSAQLTWHVRDNMFVRTQLTREDFAGHDEQWVGMVQFNAAFGSHAGHNH